MKRSDNVVYEDIIIEFICPEEDLETIKQYLKDITIIGLEDGIYYLEQYNSISGFASDLIVLKEINRGLFDYVFFSVLFKEDL